MVPQAPRRALANQRTGAGIATGQSGSGPSCSSANGEHASTLKRYLGCYRQWRLWLGEAKLRQPPGRPSDLVDYLLARRDVPCGRSAPEAILKAIAWVERVAEFEETRRATHGRLAWAAKDKITEILSEGARLIKRAPRYPVFMLMLLEALVIDVGHATGWRIWAWAKLVKVWAPSLATGLGFPPPPPAPG